MSVGRICTRVVATAVAEESVWDVARRMEEHNVGTVVVTSPTGEPLAIVTDRDVVVRCVARSLDPKHTPVSVIMTRGVRTVDEATPIEQALRTMAQVRARRLVVTGEQGKLAGILSVDDVILLLGEEAASVGLVLAEASPELVPRR